MPRPPPASVLKVSHRAVRVRHGRRRAIGRTARPPWRTGPEARAWSSRGIRRGTPIRAGHAEIVAGT